MAYTIANSINFMKYRWVSAIFSVFLVSTFLIAYVYKSRTQGQAFNYSVEFTGGIQVLLDFNKPITSRELVKILDTHGWPGSQTRQFSDHEYLVRVKKDTGNIIQESENIKSVIKENIDPSYNIEIKQTDSIGSATGSKLWKESFYAIVLSLIFMLIYIGLRFFSFAFAAGAVVSLAHDALVILTVFLLLNKEISINVIGAILAVLGYSINDTIVIFAKIRENIKKLPADTPIKDIINLSISETLRRTVLTTVATLLGVFAIYIFGGETLSDLTLALIIGIIFGIYSTIFIANPIFLMLYKK